jgi:hypothetical protein
VSGNIKHYIFGYGSLINSISRQVTGDTGRAVPVKVAGFSRYWAKISEGFGMSSVVVVPDNEGVDASARSKCNGVLVEVNESEFDSFDERERGYQRVLVEAAQVEFYDDADKAALSGANSEIKIWLYQTNTVINPCQDFPVVFSYLDVILAGCLEYSAAFCDDFLEMTQGWQFAVLNDRQNPRYPRVQPNLDVLTLGPLIAKKCLLEQGQLCKGYKIA